MVVFTLSRWDAGVDIRRGVSVWLSDVWIS